MGTKVLAIPIPCYLRTGLNQTESFAWLSVDQLASHPLTSRTLQTNLLEPTRNRFEYTTKGTFASRYFRACVSLGALIRYIRYLPYRLLLRIA